MYLYIDANTKAKERNEIFSDLTENKITDYVLIGTSKLLGEGTDIPSIKNVFCASPAYPPFEDTATFTANYRKSYETIQR